MLYKSSLFLLAILPFSVSAEGFMPWSHALNQADSNGDGGLSMEEVMDHKLGEGFVGFQPWMQDHFAKCDSSGDGIVMMDELNACKKAMGMSDAELDRAFFENTGFMPGKK